MNELQQLQQKVEELERKITALERDPFVNLSTNDVERLKGYIIERTTTGTSGSVSGALIFNVNGERRAVPYYTSFPTTP